jgi:hypothetical protein
VTPQPQYTKTSPISADRWNCTCEQPEGWLVCPSHNTTAQRDSQPSGPPMRPNPHTTPPTADTAAPERPVAPVPEGHPPADGDADSERIRPAATLSDLDRLMANAFERWRLIQHLAAIDPYVTFSIQGNASGSFCRHCNRPNSGTQAHAVDCLWVRANRLVDQADDRP